MLKFKLKKLYLRMHVAYPAARGKLYWWCHPLLDRILLLDKIKYGLDYATCDRDRFVITKAILAVVKDPALVEALRTGAPDAEVIGWLYKSKHRPKKFTNLQDSVWQGHPETLLKLVTECEYSDMTEDAQSLWTSQSEDISQLRLAMDDNEKTVSFFYIEYRGHSAVQSGGSSARKWIAVYTSCLSPAALLPPVPSFEEFKPVLSTTTPVFAITEDNTDITDTIVSVGGPRSDFWAGTAAALTHPTLAFARYCDLYKQFDRTAIADNLAEVYIEDSAVEDHMW